MDRASEFRRCLLELDVESIKRLWKFIAPELPQPKNDAEALYTLHLARTKSEVIPARLKRYSQEWLNENGFPVVTHAVGVAVGFPGEYLRPRQQDVRDAMSESVMDSYRDGIDLDREAVEVKSRMMIVRSKIHRLFTRGFRLD